MNVISKILKTILLLLLCITGLNLDMKAQEQKEISNVFYTSLAMGYARAEDNVPSIDNGSFTQMVPAIKITGGYRLNKRLAVEVSFNSLLSRLEAEGNQINTNNTSKIEPLYSSFGLQGKYYFPIGQKVELLLGAGLAYLSADANIESELGEINDNTVTDSNFGYLASFGATFIITKSAALELFFDLSDQYGSEDAWKGDLGVLMLGYQFRFN